MSTFAFKLGLCLFVHLADPSSKAETSGKDEADPLLAGLRKSGGTLDAALRNAYFDTQERRVLAELAARKISLTPEQLGLIRSDPALRDACYGLFDAPDPRIALNLLELKLELGDALFAKYKNLCVAAAVARRFKGVGAGAGGEKEEWVLRSRSEAEARQQRRFWPEYPLLKINGDAQAGEMQEDEDEDDEEEPEEKSGAKEGRKKSPRAKVVKKRQEKFERSQDRLTSPAGTDIVFNFLQERKITPRQLFESEPLKKELLAKLGREAPESGSISSQLLEKVMLAKGLRPARRDPFPGVAEWIRYLDSIDPRFPVTSAPWPILMPLAKGWPLREARDIWQRCQKGGKLPTYGKYQGKDKVIPARLEPSPWAWSSWQGTYQAGGVCHEMSSIGLGTLISLGVPACKAGQPHHSCLIVFNHNKGSWSVSAKQGRHGPADTHSQWLFADPKAELPEIHHIGLALAMNQGVASYVDSRIALHLAERMETADPALARRIAEDGLRRCPWNVELWQKMRQLGTGRPAEVKAGMIRLAHELIPSRGEAVVYHPRPGTEPLPEADDEDQVVTDVRLNSGNFLRLLSDTLMLPLEPTGDAATDRHILALLEPCRGSSIPVERVLPDFEVAVKGWRSLKPVLAEQVRKYAAMKKDEGQELAAIASSRLQAVLAKADDDRELLPWLQGLEAAAAARMHSKFHGRKPSLDPLYEEINHALAALCAKLKMPEQVKRLADKLAAATGK
ncbi:MAG: hypothetical protein RL095_3446 [Verrucomicrobiota bacterium]|jgi:hypothetical protein